MWNDNSQFISGEKIDAYFKFPNLGAVIILLFLIYYYLISKLLTNLTIEFYNRQQVHWIFSTNSTIITFSLVGSPLYSFLIRNFQGDERNPHKRVVQINLPYCYNARFMESKKPLGLNLKPDETSLTVSVKYQQMYLLFSIIDNNRGQFQS